MSDCNSSVCEAQLVFVSLPANKTVTEGDDANFTCSVTFNGNPDPVNWRLRGGEDNIDQRVQLSTADIPGVERVVVAGPLRSPIVLNNVSRSLDGLFVSCLGENQQGMLIEQADPPAVLGVICEFLVIFSVCSWACASNCSSYWSHMRTHTHTY